MVAEQEFLEQLKQFRDEIIDLQNLCDKEVSKQVLKSLLESLKEKIYVEFKHCLDMGELDSMDVIGKNYYCPVVYQLWAEISFLKVSAHQNKEFSVYLSEARRKVDYFIEKFEGERVT